MKYKLVNNLEYDITGVYYGGLSKKYSDMFNITIEKFATTFDTIEQAKNVQEMIKRRFDYNYEIEECKGND